MATVDKAFIAMLTYYEAASRGKKYVDYDDLRLVEQIFEFLEPDLAWKFSGITVVDGIRTIWGYKTDDYAVEFFQVQKALDDAKVFLRVKMG